MDIVFKCLRECFACVAKKAIWMLLLAVLFALLVLFLIMGGWDQAMFINMVIAAFAGAVIISLICCFCSCVEKLEG